jgi:hypothetical protein
MPAPTRADWAGERVARRMVFLIATAAIGYGIAGAQFPNLLGMEKQEADAFPERLGRQIAHLTVHQS